MSPITENLLDRAQAFLDDQVRSAIRRHYFPEMWYAVENWFQLLKGNRAMSVGHGIGLVAEAMAKSNWQITCVDAAIEPLEKLRERFAKNRLSAVFSQSDLTSLPGDDGSFDAIVAINSLEYSPSPINTLREIGRLLGPEGRALVSVFNRHSLWGTLPVLRSATTWHGETQPLPLTKKEFIDLLGQSALTVTQITERARYLPSGHGPKLRLPVAGAFVALIGKVPRSGPKRRQKAPKPKD